MAKRERAPPYVVPVTTGQRGQTLLEAVMALALATALACVLWPSALSKNAGSVASASAALGSLVEEARTRAAASGDGSTLVVGAGSDGELLATLYGGRPTGRGAFDPTVFLRREAARVAFSTSLALPVAIFISTGGRASFATWAPSSTPLGAEPACSEALIIVLAPSADALSRADARPPPTGVRRLSLSCEDARLSV